MTRGALHALRHGWAWVGSRVDRAFGPALDEIATGGGRPDLPILDLGCGPGARPPGRIGVDRRPAPAPSVVADLEHGLPFVRTGSIGVIHASHVLEHVRSLDLLMADIARALAPGGVLAAVVPHASDPLAVSDPTHVRPFGLYTFCYLAHDGVGYRHRVPHYGEPTLVLTHLQLRFRSPSGRRRRRLERWVNARPARQERYERLLQRVVPCQEIHAVLTVPPP